MIFNKNKSTVNLITQKLFYTSIGQIIVSMLLGFSLAIMFHRVCKDNCIIYFAPHIEEIKGKTFEIEGTCYKYDSYATKCEEDEKQNLNQYINENPINKIEEEGVFNKLFSA